MVYNMNIIPYLVGKKIKDIYLSQVFVCKWYLFLAPTSEEPYISESVYLSVWVSICLWENSSILTLELNILALIHRN